MESNSLIEEIRNAGFEAPGIIIEDGKIHRFATNKSKNSSLDGWYVSFGKAGAFGSWRENFAQNWGGRELSEQEAKEIERQKEQALKQAKFEAQQASARAKAIFESASWVGKSEYLKKKGITQPLSVKHVTGLDSKAFGFEKSWELNGLLVPLRDKKGEVHSLQLITTDKKFFMPKGRTSGLFHVLGNDFETASTIVIGEGLATCQSVREATNFPIVVAFSSGNLPLVAQTIRQMNGAARIIIAGDNDESGIKKANEAAKFINAEVIIAEKGDFNDVHLSKGLSFVRDCFITEENSDLWRSDLIMKNKSNGDSEVANRTANIILILENAAEFKGRVALNTFSGQIAVDKKDIVESTAIKLKAEIEKSYIPEKISTSDVIEAMHVVAENNEFHPVQDYLNSLKWDGKERIERFFESIAQIPVDEYHSSVAICFFVSAVKRIFEAGCKVDQMPIFESTQGKGKTTLFKTLFDEWYAEVTSSLNDKDFFMGLRGIWCADFGELDQFNRADSTRIKQILTMTDDHYRPAYARLAQKFPRQCIFVGGTNRDDWQKDETGGRRFLPVRIEHDINIEWVKENRDQLFAEAVMLIRRFPDIKFWEIKNAEEQQEARQTGDSWDAIIAQFIFTKVETTVSEILTNALKLEESKHGMTEQKRVGAFMAKQKVWIKQRIRKNGALVWVYKRKE